MLLKTTAEIRAIFPRLLAKLNNNAFIPDLDKAEQKYLVPFIGTAMLDEYQALYDTQAAAGIQVQILKNMQRVAAAYALLDELPGHLATITDGGIQSQQTNAMPRIFGWEYKAFKNGLQDAAADAVDLLLQSLWANKLSLGTWTGSDEYKQYKGLLFRNAMQFNKAHELYQPQRTFHSMRSVIRDCQEIIKQEIGDTIVTYFLQSDQDGNESLAAVLDDIRKALAFFSIKRAIEHYTVRITTDGFTVVNMAGDGENQETAGRSGTRLEVSGFLNLKKAACERDGKYYLGKVKKDLATYAKKPAAPADFIEAFSSSSLARWDPNRKRDLGNGRRKIFRTA